MLWKMRQCLICDASHPVDSEAPPVKVASLDAFIVHQGSVSVMEPYRNIPMPVWMELTVSTMRR